MAHARRQTLATDPTPDLDPTPATRRASVVTFRPLARPEVAPKPKRGPRKLKNLWRRKDASGTEYGFYQIRARINGAWLNESTGVETQKEAEAIRDRRIREERERHGGLANTRDTVGSWWTTFKATFLKSPLRGAKTVRNYEQAVLPFVALHRDTKLKAIDYERCAAYLGTLVDTHKPGTIHTYRICLGAFFRQAVKTKRIFENPWKETRAKKGEPREVILDVADQPTYLACLLPDDQTFVLTVLETGLRHGEADQLRPCDVHPDRINVRACTAKYGRGRVIPIQPQTYALIEQQRLARKLVANSTARLWDNARTPDTPLTTRKRNRIARVQARTAKAGLGHLTIHDLRRTYGTRCALAGVMPKTLMALMGHKTMTVTMTHYTIVNAMNNAQAIAQVAFPRP